MEPNSEESDKSRKKVQKLVNFLRVPYKETIFYHLCYWTIVSYSLYKFYKRSKGLKSKLPVVYKNNLFGTHQDQNDWEWNVFLPVIIDGLPFQLLHFFLAQIIKKYYPKILPGFYVAFSTLMLMRVIDIAGTVLCYGVVTFMMLALLSQSKTVIWVCWCLTLIALNTRTVSQSLGLWLSDVTDGEYKTSVIVAWIILRGVSFALETCQNKEKKNMIGEYLSALAYSLYFPLVITGPYMPYSDFQNGLKISYEKWTVLRALKFTANLMRFLIWIVVTDSLLYYFYAHSFNNSPNVLRKFNSWTLCGYSYFILIFFLLKYVVFYGFTATFAVYEGFEPPPPPKCVLITFRYKDIWRYFDCGLYKFMTKHIYIPFMGGDRSIIRQVQGAVIVFTFIYVWHGVTSAIFWWSTLNCIGVSFEKVIEDFFCAYASKKKELNSFLKKRLVAFVFSILVTCSTLTMLVFLTSLEAAIVVAKRVFISGFPRVTVTSLFTFYCITQSGIALHEWRTAKKKIRTE